MIQGLIYEDKKSIYDVIIPANLKCLNEVN